MQPNIEWSLLKMLHTGFAIMMSRYHTALHDNYCPLLTSDICNFEYRTRPDSRHRSCYRCPMWVEPECQSMALSMDHFLRMWHMCVPWYKRTPDMYIASGAVIDQLPAWGTRPLISTTCISVPAMHDPSLGCCRYWCSWTTSTWP